jgi:hypothetical protein
MALLFAGTRRDKADASATTTAAALGAAAAIATGFMADDAYATTCATAATAAARIHTRRRRAREDKGQQPYDHDLPHRDSSLLAETAAPNSNGSGAERPRSSAPPPSALWLMAQSD